MAGVFFAGVLLAAGFFAAAFFVAGFLVAAVFVVAGFAAGLDLPFPTLGPVAGAPLIGSGFAAPSDAGLAWNAPRLLNGVALAAAAALLA
ncbi:MAG: hypothetical protein JO278_07520, partial [Dyella sp.]|nr:hypothetical protein [Dyella sp.]